MAWMTAYLLKPYDKDDMITPGALLGKPSGSAAELEALLGLSVAPDAGYEFIMKKQRDRKDDGGSR
jgi:hypothetical protein